MASPAAIWSLAFLLFATLFALSAVGAYWIWQRWRRKRRRFPFGRSVRLLRQAGEGLASRMRQLEDRIVMTVMGGISLPYFTACGVALLAVAASKRGLSLPPGVIIGLAVVAGLSGIGIAVARLLRLLRELSDCHVGYCGERLVAEKLRPLERSGWIVLHDVPMTGRSGSFNIDHVAIGPAGVFAVETKTPRKFVGTSEAGHFIDFDGQHLRWPDGRCDSADVRATLDRARDLGEWLKRRTGESIPVKPILVYPEWYVHECKPPSERIRVLAPSFLFRAIYSRGRRDLTAAQIRACAVQVASLCRTVEV